MTTPDRQAPHRKPRLDAHQQSPVAYIRQARAKLATTRHKLDAVRTRIAAAVADGRLNDPEAIEKAQRRVDAHLETIELLLARLARASDDSRQALRRSVDQAWDDLGGAVKNVIRRLS